MKNLVARSLTGILFVIVIVAAILGGAYTYLFVFGIIALLGYFEFIRLTQFGRQLDRGMLSLDLAGAYALFLSIFSFSHQFSEEARCIFVLSYLAYLTVRPVLQLYYHQPGESLISGWAYSILGHLYVVVPFALLATWGYDVESPIAHPEYLLLALFVFVWTNDTGAFLVGCTLGKHRLFERISPKKSWEGFFGGLAFCIILGACANLIIPSILTTAQWIGMGALTSIFSTWGDLCESMLKRTAGVKDSGKILPGHGGILDRFDSELLASPVIFIYLALVL